MTPRTIAIRVGESETRVGDRIGVAESFGARLRGLMFRRALEEGEGLLLLETASIHMCFMRFPIDAVFLDRDWRVVRVVERLPPWIGLASAEAAHVLELPAGAAGRAGVRVGHRLREEDAAAREGS